MSVEIGKKYKHYKGNVYEIITFAKHTETMEDLVIYKSVSDGKIWARPLVMFSEKRQGIHDLIAHTDVVKCDLVKEMETCEN